VTGGYGQTPLMLPHSRFVGTAGRWLHLMNFRRIPVIMRRFRQLMVAEIRCNMGFASRGLWISLLMQGLPIQASGGGRGGGD